MAVTTVAQTIVVDGVIKLALAEIEQDTTTGDYVRDVRVFAAGSAGAQMEVLRLQVRSTTREGIEVTTPSLTV